MIERTPLWHRLNNADRVVAEARERFEAMHDYDADGDASPEGIAFDAAIAESTAALDAVCEMETERDRLRVALAERDARIAELEAGLRPFAAIADAVEPMVSRGNMHPDLQTWVATGRIAVLTFSDCDRARALLAKGGAL